MEREDKTLESMGEIEQIRVLSELVARNRYSQLLGMSFSDKRDIYAALGYKRDLVFSDYWNVFKRGRLGKRVLCAPVDSTWRGDVAIIEGEKNKETEFEKAVKELDKNFKLFHKFSRLDKLVGLGDFGVMLFGVDDGLPLEQPLTPQKTGRKLLYLQPYSQNNIDITEWDKDTNSPRYGLPVIYTLKMRSIGSLSTPDSGLSVRVHYTRVVHVADGLLDNDVVGTPRLESSYNALQDLEKIAGGSGEMYWQGALGGKAFTAKEGATLDSASRTAMQDEIDEYVHGLRRYLRLQNVDVKELAPQTSDPGPAIQAQVDLISGNEGIPKRILIGSERGELASTQDESNWLNRIKERRTQFAEPCIIRPSIDLLISVGVLPQPSDEYQIEWPDLWASSATEQATVSKTKTEALAAYVGAPGADQVVPVEFFLQEFLNMSTEQIERIKKVLGNLEERPIGGEGTDEEDLTANFNFHHDRIGRFSSGSGYDAMLNIMQRFGMDHDAMSEVLGRVAMHVKQQTGSTNGLYEVMRRFGFSEQRITEIIQKVGV